MESIVVLTLVGLGYIFSKEKKKENNLNNGHKHLKKKKYNL